MGKHGDPEVIRKNIELAVAISEGRTIEEIAEKLGITCSKARNYYRGHPSSGAYTEELERLTRTSREMLEKRLGSMHFLKQPIKSLKKGKSIVIKFYEKYLPVRSRMRELRSNLDSNLMQLGMYYRMSKRIRVHYKDGKFSLRTKDIRARAFLNAYADVVLSRELVK